MVLGLLMLQLLRFLLYGGVKEHALSMILCVCVCGAEANTHGSVKGKQALDTEPNSQLYKWCFEF